MVASFTVYFNIKKNILNTLLDGLSPRHLQFFIFQCRDSGPASTIQIIHFFNIRDCFVFKSVVIYCYMYTQSVQHILWSRFHKFQSSQSKTRENIFHFFLCDCIEPRTFHSWVFCLAFWAITSCLVVCMQDIWITGP